MKLLFNKASLCSNLYPSIPSSLSAEYKLQTPHLGIAVDSFLTRVLQEMWGNKAFPIAQVKAINTNYSQPVGSTVPTGRLERQVQEVTGYLRIEEN